MGGIRVGHHHRIGVGWLTGTTVVLADDGVVAGVDVRGGAPGTRETDALAPEKLVQRVQGVCLSGGSAYGLAAADGVMRWLGERNRGLPVGAQPHEVVPVVPAAVLFDLPRGDWGNRPDAEFGYRACAAARTGPVEQGCVGAGTGAVVGGLKGGVGTASAVLADGTVVGALAVVNAVGSAVDARSGLPWALDAALDGEFDLSAPRRGPLWPDAHGGGSEPLNTTLAVVATDAALTKTECHRLATVAHDGLARAVRPMHTMFDGDTIFGLATGARELGTSSAPFGSAERAAALDQVTTAGTDVLVRAIGHALLAASPAAGIPSYADVWPPA